jgi:DNA-binding NarL/FixJ family response regulator
MTPPIRVLIVDDHEIVREGLQTLLSEEADILVVGQAANGSEALAQAAATRPDVILMDLVMPEMDGIQATAQVRRAQPASQVLVLTSFVGDQRVRDAMQAGAIGYLMKDVLKSDLLHAIRQAAQGKPTLHAEAQSALIRQAMATTPSPPPHAELTERERDVLALIAQGKSNKEIAAALHLTEGTVKGYVSAILTKLGVADRTQAALYAVKHGLEKQRGRGGEGEKG